MPLMGSGASILFDLRTLHPMQANAQFSGVDKPPRVLGAAWSSVNSCPVHFSSIRQYSQRPAARSRTFARDLAMRGGGDAERTHQLSQRHTAHFGQFRQRLEPLHAAALNVVGEIE